MPRSRTKATTLVFEVPPTTPLSEEDKASAMTQLLKTAVESRKKVLHEEGRLIIQAITQNERGMVDMGRWNRTSNQLDLLERVAVSIGALLDDRTQELRLRLERVSIFVEQTLHQTMSALLNEAMTLSNDMEALATRLREQGQDAEVDDIQSPRWYCTAAQLRALKKLYLAISQILGRPASSILPLPDQESGGTSLAPSGMDDAQDD